MNVLFWKLRLASCFAVLLTYALPASAQTIHLKADLRDAPRKWIHAQLAIPVQPGPLALVYPQWIPGEHAPTGPVENLAGLIFTANGKRLPWRRDDVNMYEIRVDVPEGATELDAQLDFLATADPAGFSSGASTTNDLAVVNWNQILLYPVGKPSREIVFQPSLVLPDGWKFGTALTRVSGTAEEISFQPLPLNMLVDSPVLTGKYFREIPLAPEVTPKHYLDIAADAPEQLAITPDGIEEYSRLVREAGALFASRHYDSYHFLLTLSDNVAHFGLEHHQSSDDRTDARMFLDEDLDVVNADLLPHEFTHSWNGKYRRPAGLATSDFQQPMKGALLWVYEGLTQYYGEVLATRSGLWTPEEFRAHLAAVAAEMNNRPGRTWRDLEDTAVAAQILYDSVRGWDNWRRSTDFYDEGALIWLEADTLIRKLSNGAKSLDDFAALFYGTGGNTGPILLTYTFDDVVRALNDTQPYDWATFLRQRLTSTAPHAPLNGIANGGYKLEYNAEANEYLRADDAGKGDVTAWYSIGVDIGGDMTIHDVLVGSPAYKAGLGPGMKIVAVNSRRATAETVRQAIADTTNLPNGVDLIVSNGDAFRVVHIDYRGGERYPHLIAVKGAHDLLADIIRPRVQPKQAPKEARGAASNFGPVRGE